MMPFNMNPQNILQQILRSNPNMQQNPQMQNYIQVLMSGDSARGEELARNLCQSMGISPEEGVSQAQQMVQQFLGQNRQF